MRLYDQLTFEEGMKTLDEILKGMAASDIFVLFLSNAALESDWVKIEISNAKLLLDTSQLERILPFSQLTKTSLR